MTLDEHRPRSITRRAAALLAAVAATPALCAAQAGVWTPLTHTAPAAIGLMMLLPDGTVMAAKSDGASIFANWLRLTPDASGSYVNGTWSTLASAPHTRLYFPSQVLRDGRVMVAGGEYGTGGPFAEIYDPQTNLWTSVTPPGSLWNTSNDNFFDCNSEMLPDGSVLFMPVFPHSPGIPLRYNPATDTWSNAGHLFRGTYQDEASWVKLADDSILTIDPFGTFSERYIPATNSWVDDGIVPVSLYDPFGFELGGALLLPNGKAFFLGSTGHTALYTPSGTTSPGVWSAGPDIPGAHGTPDAPAAMMVNGRILCAVSPIPTSGNHFPSPTSFYEYDPIANSFASINGPTGASMNAPTYQFQMLCLPDGSVLMSNFNSQLYVYRPSGAPQAAWKPTINNVVLNPDGSYHLEGTQLNGISAGATYGDDAQMNTNYPLVRLTDGVGNVYYARTYDWSSTGVQTGATVVTTEFRVPATLPPVAYTLEVVANGIASDPIPFGSTCTLPTTYCTAKFNSLFCSPAISWTGLPSLSNSTPFNVTCSQVINNKSGLLFYGLTPAAKVFQGGFLCVHGPTKRTQPQSSGGTPTGNNCSGTYSFDFSALANSGSDPNLVNGTTIYCQYWSRDPQDLFGFNTSFSNALSFTFCP